MARSKEAIKRRAAKRGVDEAEMRIRDNPAGAKKQKGIDGEIVSTTTMPEAVKASVVKTSASVVKAPAKAVVSNDWVCTKCNNKNFATRSNCNRCGDCRGVTSSSPSVPVPAVQPAASKDHRPPMRQKPPSASLDPRDVRYSKKPATIDPRDVRYREPVTASSSSASSSAAVSVSVSGTKEGTWKCPQCANSNFPQRTDCNRCGTAKPSSTATTTVSSTASSSSSSSSSPVATTATNTKPIPKSKEYKKNVSDGKGKTSSSMGSASTLIVKTKWAKQASAEEVAENQRLREVAARLLATQGKGTEEGTEEGVGVGSSEPLLTEAEMARAKVLLERSQRKKEKKETMKKWKDKKQLTKAKQRQPPQKTSTTTDSPASTATAKSTTKSTAKTTKTTATTATTTIAVVKKVTAKQTPKPKPKPAETVTATDSL